MVAARTETPIRKPATITDIRTRMGPIAERMERDGARAFYEAMRNQGIATLSELLETEDPSDPEERRQGFDAFTRLFVVADIKTASDPNGSYRADTLEKMGSTQLGRTIFPEWVRRRWMASSEPQRQQRAPAVYMSNDFIIGSIQRPWEDDTTPISSRLEPAIPLSSIIRGTRTVDGPDFRSRYLVAPTAAETRMLRVAEGAEIPAATITEGSRTIRLRKFGRLLRATYEAMRRTPMDDFGVYLDEIRVQTEVDQVGAATDVSINGDGNANTSATVYNLTALDPATTANNLTPAAYFSFKLKWRNPFQLSVILGREAAVIKLLSLALANANTLVANTNLPVGLRAEFTPLSQRTADGVAWGATDDVAANYLLGLDTRFAVERLLESGSDITEAERWITRQTEALAMTFNEAYRVVNPLAAKMIRLDA